MPQTQSPARLHFRQQEAAALLDPLRIELHRMERRIGHYLERVILSDDDAARLSQAQAAISQAASRIDALQAEATEG